MTDIGSIVGLKYSLPILQIFTHLHGIVSVWWLVLSAHERSLSGEVRGIHGTKSPDWISSQKLGIKIRV